MLSQPSLISMDYERPSMSNALPIRERPVYRVASDADSCNLTELLSVIIGGSSQMELAQHMLVTFGSIHRIANASVEEISKVKGITTLTATRLKACISLGRRLLTPEEDRNPIHSPGDSAAIFTPMMAHLEYECLMVMVLDARNKIIEVVDLYHGSLNSSTVRVAEIFKAAIRLNSPSVIIAHNHPSGDPTPSPEDISLTRSIVQSGKLMNIILLDHLVICTSKWVSLKEKGLGF